ncbi:TVP38/TMEM64 family protein [Parasedimentitalea huanghaiensis]|uniref:TVP38/TMEM64 family membrane protein n=1 Tax=Parasedimentitalea huanghaiensis TaxID=2682100 RepID=A0A6L6WH93_9RHOB|nr:TVP38/TMEM64 family protein [Zongyanglinia huanghaiensis]MVO16319.1 TVP38/TMEM64 family protein [Zongyanglinia huanghaiensis]
MTLSGRSVALWGIAVVLLLGSMLAYVSEGTFPTPEALADQLRATGAWAPVAIIALMVLHSFIPFPAEILAICAGAVFGTLVGSALVWVGAMLGALAAFGLSRKLGRSVIQSWLSKGQSARLDEWTDQQGTFTLLISRFIPVIAFNLINYAAGLTRVRLWTFVWTTGLGIVPITVLSAYLGAHMKNMSWPLLLMVSGGGIVTLCLLQRLVKSRRQN